MSLRTKALNNDYMTRKQIWKLYVCMYAWMYVCMYVWMQVHGSVYVCMYVCMHILICVCTCLHQWSVRAYHHNKVEKVIVCVCLFMTPIIRVIGAAVCNNDVDGCMYYYVIKHLSGHVCMEYVYVCTCVHMQVRTLVAWHMYMMQERAVIFYMYCRS